MNKKWEVHRIEEKDINKICEENNLSKLVSSILIKCNLILCKIKF